MKLGVIINLNDDLRKEFMKLKDLGFSTCQLCCWEEKYFNDEYAAKVNSAVKEYGIDITGFWCGWGTGPVEWNFYEGQETLGLIPPSYRALRLNILLKGSDFAKKIGVTDFITHAGFIPENPYDQNYAGLISSLRHIVQRCSANGQYFLFETGQETPVTLLRAIQDIGMDNIGVNLDPANLLMYGKANPIDSLDIIGKYVRGVHGKDGEYPTNGKWLGAERQIGQGRVNFPVFVEKLKELGYKGAITIEREISGEQQIKDILEAKSYLEKLIG